MLRNRIIPCLLLQEDGLVKTTRYKKSEYVGDPINAVKIFNEKEVDELVFLDIAASRHNQPPNFSLIKKIASECFMPFCYGGGIKSMEDIRKILHIGAEKVAFNSVLFNNMNLIKTASKYFGCQSIVESIDVKKNLFYKYRVYNHTTNKTTRIDPVRFSKTLEELGAGEIFLTSVDLDGTMSGFDIELIKSVSENVNIPVIACGGAGRLKHIKNVFDYTKVNAVAAGSLFVFNGKHRAVLINYPTYDEIEAFFKAPTTC